MNVGTLDILGLNVNFFAYYLSLIYLCFKILLICLYSVKTISIYYRSMYLIVLFWPIIYVRFQPAYIYGIPKPNCIFMLNLGRKNHVFCDTLCIAGRCHSQ